MQESNLNNDSRVAARQAPSPESAPAQTRGAKPAAAAASSRRPARSNLPHPGRRLRRDSSGVPLLLYTQHLSGTGHLVRALTVADALADSFDVTVVSGGKFPGIDVPQRIRFVQLSPIGFPFADEERLLSWDRRRSLARVMAERTCVLNRLYAELKPAVIVIESFPFTHLSVMGELLPLLNRAKREKQGRPLLFCSTRDIGSPAKANTSMYDDLACTLSNYLYDGILVHSDPRFFRFEETFKPSFPLIPPLYYTGFVAPDSGSSGVAAPAKRRPFIVVSAGGGRVGGSLLRKALDAYKRARDYPPFDLLLITGPFFPEVDNRKLRYEMQGVRGVRIARWRKDFQSLLRQADGVISQCGYNTTMDILKAGIPALVVPYCNKHNTEQLIRAEKLTALGLTKLLSERAITPAGLYAEMENLLQFKPARGVEMDFSGASTTARVLARCCYKRRRI